MMAIATILYIRHPNLKDDGLFNALARKYPVETAGSGKDALSVLTRIKPDVIILNAHSLRTTGERISRQIKAMMPDTPLIHLPLNHIASESSADVILADVTPRRLTNSVGRFVTNKREEVLTLGPFEMNVPRRILIAHGEEKQLTPKQAQLVALFLRNPDQTIERKRIMSEVWDTEYIGDTRTLDVHIRWLREVMETNSKKPRYLKTVRGVGYRLESDNNSPSNS
jgi:DNA-binding response OmpR family regulator